MASSHIYSFAELQAMIRPLVEKYGMKGARLFGSYARSEARAESDIDVLLDGGSNFRALDVFALAEELLERSGKSVDVYELSELDPGAFRQTVLREAVAL